MGLMTMNAAVAASTTQLEKHAEQTHKNTSLLDVYREKQRELIDMILAMSNAPGAQQFKDKDGNIVTDLGGGYFKAIADTLQGYIDLLKRIAENPQLGTDFGVNDSLTKAEDLIRRFFPDLSFQEIRRLVASGAFDESAAGDILRAGGVPTEGRGTSLAPIGGSATGSTLANFNLAFGSGAAGASLAEQIAFLVAQQQQASNDEMKTLYQREIDALKTKLDALPVTLTEKVTNAVLTAPAQVSAKDLYLTGRLR